MKETVACPLPAAPAVAPVSSALPAKPKPPVQPKTWDAQATRDYNTAFAQYKVDMEDWLNQLNRIDAAAATREQQRHNRRPQQRIEQLQGAQTLARSALREEGRETIGCWNEVGRQGACREAVIGRHYAS